MLDADLDLTLIGLCQNLFHFLRRLLEAIQSIARQTAFRGLAGTTHKSYGNYYGENRDCQSPQVKNRGEKTPIAPSDFFRRAAISSLSSSSINFSLITIS